RQFALEALQLAIRIRGDALPPQPLEVGADAPAAHAGSAAQNGPGTEASERLTAELDPTAAPSAAIAAGSSRARLGVGRAALTTGTAALGLAVAVAGLAS